MRSLNEWILTYNAQSMLSLKSSILTRLMNKYDSRVPLIEKGQASPLFLEPFVEAIVLRALLTPYARREIN